MKQSTSGFLLVGGLFGLLVLLNFLFFVDSGTSDETEQNGNRSSYQPTPYGTLAYYTLLEESGYKVTRLQVPYTRLKERPDVGALVVIAPPVFRNPSEEELESLTRWVEGGGVVVIIDREIRLKFNETEIDTHWGVSMAGIHPLQPTAFTRGVVRVQLSQQATSVTVNGPGVVAHLGNDRAVVLADASLGKGRIVLLTDPYVVANNGISQADNSVLAMNLFAGWSSGMIAFDEYHHGFGASQGGGLMAYFRGTPAPWMMAQAGLIAIIAVYSYGRRFGRPVPLRQERRTTNLEFVSGMANITRLARARDVAMQNIYLEFRKRLCRYSSVPSKIETTRLAAAVARRATLDERELGRLLMHCEQVMRGRTASDGDLLELVTKIREIEAQLKL
jgi:hypothetical protein